MATSKENSPPISLMAEEAIVAHRLVMVGVAADSCLYTTAITSGAVGVSLATEASGESLAVQSTPGSVVKLTAQAAISVGDLLMPHSSGLGKVVTLSGATATPVGRALQAALADLDVIEVLFQPSNIGTA